MSTSVILFDTQLPSEDEELELQQTIIWPVIYYRK